jgi:PIN domain nuclease of toxin-antitoxin system
MSLLLDTHILLVIARGDIADKYPQFSHALSAEKERRFGSVASLWEIAIKLRIGKLELGMEISEFEEYLSRQGVNWLSINPAHAAALVLPEPDTNDPFDRMLLAQCKVEGFHLVTVDRALAGHPLALQF